MEGNCNGAIFTDSSNVKEHATLSAGAHVDHGVKVGDTEDHVNRAADRGCCVSACSLLLHLGVRHQSRGSLVVNSDLAASLAAIRNTRSHDPTSWNSISSIVILAPNAPDDLSATTLLISSEMASE